MLVSMAAPLSNVLFVLVCHGPYQPASEPEITHGFSNRCHCIGLGLEIEGVFGQRATAGITVLGIIARRWATDATRRWYRCNH